MDRSASTLIETNQRPAVQLTVAQVSLPSKRKDARILTAPIRGRVMVLPSTRNLSLAT